MSYLKKQEVNVDKEKEIQEAVNGIERLEKESRMIKTVKILNGERLKNLLYMTKMKRMYQILKKFTK